MVVLGLGSNLGDRLFHLRQAFKLLKQVPFLQIEAVSPVYQSDAMLPEDAPAAWNQDYFNYAILCHTTVDPFTLLKRLKEIELSVGRDRAKAYWGPRVIDIDILAWDDMVLDKEILTLPHKGLPNRPFALWPMADVAPLWRYPVPGPYFQHTAEEMAAIWNSRFTGDAPFHTRQIYQRIDTPELIGTINVTPDSFSDGGQFMEPEKAVNQALQLVATGASILDFGAESTSPAANAITPHQEWERLYPVLSAIIDCRKQLLFTPKISVDTRNIDTAEKALALGVDWINDVSGLDQPAMRQLVADHKADCVVMHHIQLPERRDHVLPRGEDPIAPVYAWGEQRIAELVEAGIDKNKIIFDPGIGFGKLAEHSYLLIQQIQAFHTLGVRVLVGHSRKSFLSRFSHLPYADRDVETMTLALHLARQQIDYLRVHNVEMCARAFKFANLFLPNMA